MNESELRRIIEEVTAQVLAAAPKAPGAPDGAEKILVVGDVSKVPREIAGSACLCGIEEYESCRYVAPYSKVIISELSLVQLCDIALGRPSDAACCAVIQALLHGKSVILLENGLPHRAFAGKGSTALYGKLEGYVRTLSSYGVKLLSDAKIYRPAEVPVKPAKHQAPAAVVPQGGGVRNSAKLITEEIALSLVKDCAGTVTVAPDAIITPSARDVFTKMRVTVEKG